MDIETCGLMIEGLELSIKELEKIVSLTKGNDEKNVIIRASLIGEQRRLTAMADLISNDYQKMLAENKAKDDYYTMIEKGAEND